MSSSKADIRLLVLLITLSKGILVTAVITLAPDSYAGLFKAKPFSNTSSLFFLLSNG